MRVRVLIEGEGVQLEAGNPQPFIDAAGERYVGTDGDMVLIRSGDGSVQAARPGWYAVVPDGGGAPAFAVPDLVRPA